MALLAGMIIAIMVGGTAAASPAFAQPAARADSIVIPLQVPASPPSRVNPSNLAAAKAAQLGPWSTGSITFKNGVPVGGWAELTLFSNGNYRFRGHFHVSGAPSYNVELAWGVRDARGRLYTFSRSGHLAGTFEPGSRDYDWDVSGHNNQLAAGWSDLNAHWNYKWNAAVNWDAKALVNQVTSAISTVGTVVSVIGVVV
ncbi:MAG: hypothetical protein ACRDRI_04785 [Pseudonocardiaceae bacterium]